MRKDMRSMALTTTLSEEQIQSAGDGKYPLAPADFTDYYLKGVYSGQLFDLGVAIADKPAVMVFYRGHW